jgi:hypothetical protein
VAVSKRALITPPERTGIRGIPDIPQGRAITDSALREILLAMKERIETSIAATEAAAMVRFTGGTSATPSTVLVYDVSTSSTISSEGIYLCDETGASRSRSNRPARKLCTGPTTS